MYKLTFESDTAKKKFTDILDNAVVNYGGLLHKNLVPQKQKPAVNLRLALSKELINTLREPVYMVYIQHKEITNLIKIVTDVILALNRSMAVANDKHMFTFSADLVKREKECSQVLASLRILNKKQGGEEQIQDNGQQR